MIAYVTGVAGFLGSHVADLLAANGWQVYGADTLTTGTRANVPDTVEWTQTDICRLTASPIAA